MKQSKEQLPVALELPVAKFQVAEWGETAVAYIRLSAGADATPLLEGLPHDKSTVTGDAVCRSTNVVYRLDTASAREFLGQFVALP